MRTTSTVIALVAVAVVGVATTDDSPSGAAGGQRPQAPAAASDQPVPPVRAAEPLETATPVAMAPDEPRDDLLQAAGDGDGDSWHDTAGREYRLGLVNTPETNECYGSEATVQRKELTARGFRADVYTTDAYGRSVAVVTLADGTNLNVWLARHGYANDRYLDRFRHENPALAAELDGAFAAAAAERAGLWGACSDSRVSALAEPPVAPAPAAPPPDVGACHPDYLTCVPVQGDGSGRGAVNDLDCGQIGEQVQLRRAGVDPYRLDREGDGLGCESF